MKHTIIYAVLTLLLFAQGNASAATYPYSTTTPTTKTTKPATKTTTKPVNTVKKPAPAPKPVKEKSFFSNLSYGIMFISQSVDVTNDNGTTSVTNSESGSGIGIYADKFYKQQYRFNGTLSYISYDNFIITSLTAAADYLVPVSANIALFGGLAAGGTGQKYNNSGFGDMSLALVYGAQLGGIMFVNDNLMLELGYRLRMTNLETEITTTPVSTDTIDQLDEAYLSLVFSF
jgi:hypothetical protein